MNKFFSEVSTFEQAKKKVRENLYGYLEIGKMKARELLNKSRNEQIIRIGNRLYTHKQLLDENLLKKEKFTL